MGKKSDVSKKAAAPATPAKSPAVKPTKTTESTAVEAKQPAPLPDQPPIVVAPSPAKRSNAAKPATKKTATPVKKITSAIRNGSKAVAQEKEIVRPSLDDIALRAYFIAEARHREGLPGDSTSDWVEAERQLLSELNGKPASKKAQA